MLASLILPGLGHALLGRPLRGAGWLAAQIAALPMWLVHPMWLVAPPLLASLDAAWVAPRPLPARPELWRVAPLILLTAVALRLGGGAMVRRHVVEVNRMTATSMTPTLLDGDRFVVDKLAYRRAPPRRGDVISFGYPKDPSMDFVKRVLAVGGDTVEFRDDQPFVNGKPVPRTLRGAPCQFEDLNDQTGRWSTRKCTAVDEILDGRGYTVLHNPHGGIGHGRAPQIVPDGQLFVVGDNRDSSYDSRNFGPVPLALVRGRAQRIWWSTGPSGTRRERIGMAVQ